METIYFFCPMVAPKFIVRPSYDENIVEYLRPLFEQYYTMSFDNYPVEMERLEGANIRECG